MHLLKWMGLIVALNALGAALLTGIQSLLNRLPEIHLRIALGAGLATLFSQFAAEQFLVACLGALLGGLLAWWSSPLIALWTSFAIHVSSKSVRPDTATLLLWLLAFVVLSLVITAACLYRTGRRGRWRPTQATAGGRSLLPDGRRAVVISQFALCSSLLLVSLLFLSTLRELTSVRLGVDPTRITVATIELRNRHDRAARQAFYRTVLEQVKRTPGVEAAALASSVPGGRRSTSSSILGSRVDTRPVITIADNFVSEGYFRALGIPVLAGREFQQAETSGSSAVIIVSEALARLLWPIESPLGKLHDGRIVIGVVGDVRQNGLIDLPSPTLYLPMAAYEGDRLLVVVKSRVGASVGAHVSDGVRTECGLCALRIESLPDLIDGIVAPSRRVAITASALAIASLLLTAIALQSVMVQWLWLRRQEFAVRLALGARPRTLCRLVIGESSAIVLRGLLVGTWLAFLGRKWVSGFLFQVEAFDPLLLAAVAGACYVGACITAVLSAAALLKLEPASLLAGQREFGW
jgi:hypothetical protein